MAPTRVVAGGGITHSSSSSGIFFQGDAQSQSQTVANSNFTPSFGNSSSQVLGNVPSSAPSIGGSSLVTDANSGLPGAPHLQRSASFNTDSYMRLPASPLSFSSNNISISGSSAMDGSSVAQQSPNQGASTATSLPTSRMVQANFLKKPRLEIKQEDVLQQQVLQQLLQRQDSMQLQAASNPQLQALIQQQRLRQQQQLQAISPSQRAQLLQHQHQLQLRQQQLQQQGLQQPVSGVKRLHDSGVCSRRLMQYLYHQRQRPPDNTIAYWRKFVAEYYSPRAKKKWCLSLYDNVGHHSLGVFPQAAVDAWQCDICNSKSGRGFEATFEVLPRLNEIKFGSGVIDELLFLDLPRECRYPSGIMMLEYLKAVQESVYEQIRVIREGHLRIIFTPDLKILSWEFCARRHEELLPRRLVAPQVNQLLQVAQKCQSTIAEGGDDGVSQQDLQTNSNMVVTAGRQLARSLELQSLNDLGFSKRYVRCLQISEVVNTMKDLIDFCGEHKAGPIDGLKNIPRHPAQLQKMQEIRNLPTVKLETQNPGTPNNNNNSQTGLNNTLGRGTLTSSAQAALALTNYQTLLTKQNSTQQQQQHQQPEQETTSKLPQGSSSSAAAAAAAATATVLPGNLQQSYTRSSSFKAPPNSDSSAAAGGGNNNGIGQQKTDDFPHNLHLSDDLDIAAHDFTENGFFSSDLDDNLGYDWKA